MSLPPPPDPRRIDLSQREMRWQKMLVRDDGSALLFVWEHAQWGAPLDLGPAGAKEVLAEWRKHCAAEPTRFRMHDSAVAWGVRPPGEEGVLA